MSLQESLHRYSFFTNWGAIGQLKVQLHIRLLYEVSPRLSGLAPISSSVGISLECNVLVAHHQETDRNCKRENGCPNASPHVGMRSTCASLAASPHTSQVAKSELVEHRMLSLSLVSSQELGLEFVIQHKHHHFGELSSRSTVRAPRITSFLDKIGTMDEDKTLAPNNLNYPDAQLFPLVNPTGKNRNLLQYLLKSPRWTPCIQFDTSFGSGDRI
nr:hypothetical protein Iba_chr07cCG9000 [Ipomoea batatas]